MERINELIEGYSLENIWNMVESGCFLKALLDKGLVEKGKQAQGSKKSKQRLTVAFFVNAAGEKVEEPIVIWKSKLSRCFKKLQDPSRPANVHYFSNPKSWMTSEVMAAVLARFKRKLVFEDRKVILFLDNATCHPESMIGQFSQVKIIFLPKNTTSRLQPLDAGIIQNFKVKYRKRLVKCSTFLTCKDLGGCICNTNCQGCGCTCGYSTATRNVERSNQLKYQKLFREMRH